MQCNVYLMVPTTVIICAPFWSLENCHVNPLVVVHAPASCGRGLEGDGRSILEVMRRRGRRHAKPPENVLSDFPWHIHTEKCLLTTRLYYTRAFSIVSSPQLSRV